MSLDWANGLLHFCPERGFAMEAERDIYKKRQMHRVISVEQLVTIHYLSGIRNFGTPPERHDFWELVYVDYGGIELIADGSTFLLGSGELFLHVPGQLHAFRAGDTATAVFIISTTTTRNQVQVRISLVSMENGMTSRTMKWITPRTISCRMAVSCEAIPTPESE